jgi:hypothetical protein
VDVELSQEMEVLASPSTPVVKRQGGEEGSRDEAVELNDSQE